MTGPDGARRPRHALLDPFVVVQGRAAWVEGPPNEPTHGHLRRRDCSCHLYVGLCPPCGDVEAELARLERRR